MIWKKLLVMAVFSLFLVHAVAFTCGKGDRGGKLLEFTVTCYGLGTVEADCSDGSERPQCYKITSCSLGGCGTVDDPDYITSCKATCTDTTTFVSVTCEPLPLVIPAISLPFNEYSGYTGKEIVLEAFAADNELVKDIYLEPIEGCDLNQVREGLHTAQASLEATVVCGETFTAREVKVIVEDECSAMAEETMLLSVEKYCGRECVARLYPQCREGKLLECIEENGCTELRETECGHGCSGAACCAPLSCLDLGLECGDSINNCDENISCGSCVNGAECEQNKCIVSGLGIGTGAQQPPAQLFPFFGIEPLVIGGALIVLLAAIVVFARLRK